MSKLQELKQLVGTSALTAITAQNTKGVEAVQGVDPDLLEAQINACWQDIPPAAFKTGMLYSKDLILAVIKALEQNYGTRSDAFVPCETRCAIASMRSSADARNQSCLIRSWSRPLGILSCRKMR